MNHFYCNLDNLVNKFQVSSFLYKYWNLQPISFSQVYNVHTMKDEFMIVSGMPERNGLHLFTKNFFWSQNFSFLQGDRHVSDIASMALDLLAGSVVFQIPHRPNVKLNIRMGFHRWIQKIWRENNDYFSGPAMGVVAGNKIPSYCIMSDTGCDTPVSFYFLTAWLSGSLARVMEKMGEGMRIHISSTSKELLDRVMITIKIAVKTKLSAFRWVDSDVITVELLIWGWQFILSLYVAS